MVERLEESFGKDDYKQSTVKAYCRNYDKVVLFGWYGYEVSFKLQWFYSKESESPVAQDEKKGRTQTLSNWIFSNLEQYTKNVHPFPAISASNPAIRVPFHCFFLVKKT